ncbi:NAD(P)-binding protein [Thozetella sp. PMI_491]|nr:NAD(P)-binding protein [Thozetella sp. PMI_491]
MAPLVWLITGCSSGFGEQFVHSALARGDKVIATGRKVAERLKHLETTGAAIVDLDVTLPENEIKQIIERAAKIYGRIDVLVNNAGISSFATFEELDNDGYRKVFDVNYFGTLAVTRAVLPHMRKQGSGTVVIVGSQYGWWLPPNITAYGGTKFALEGLAHGLQVELAPFGIRTVLFEPGFFQTEMSSPGHILMAAPSNELEAYAPLRQAAAEIAMKVNGNNPGDPKKGVELMVDVIRGEGCAAGRKFPSRLPIGADAVHTVETKCKEMLKLVETWKADVVNTNRDGFEVPDVFKLLITQPPLES